MWRLTLRAWRLRWKATMLTDAQLLMRRTGLGGSDIPAILGRSDFAGPLEVWRSKVEGVVREETRWSWFGSALEDQGAAYYARFYLPPGLSLIEQHQLPPDMPTATAATDESGAVLTYRHKEHPILLCTLDRVWSDLSRIVEHKAIGENTWKKHFSTGEGKAGPPKVKAEYLFQARYQMGFFELPLHLCVVAGGNACRVFDISSREGWFARMVERAYEFWEWVERGIPNPSWTPLPRPYIRDAHPLPTSLEDARRMIVQI